jgi:RNA polymerase sigma-70 factor (ECF subfamily)
MDEAQTRAYLFRIATNLLHNRSRSRDDAAFEEPADSGMETDEAARLDVREAMRQLKPRERQLLWLAYVEGMSHAEIAAVTGLGAMSIRILLYRARQKASRILRPQRTEP